MSDPCGMDIIDLDQRRQEAQPPAPDYAVCPCGQAWFELRGTLEEAPHGAVVLSADDMSVTGYNGRPHCISCGEPYMKPLSSK